MDLKRLFDLVVAGTASLVLLPVFAVVAAAVAVSSGRPVIYRSARLGLRGRTFLMLKFRTMRVGAADLRNADGSTYSGADDPRVTAAGRLLRRTSVDELPQLWNVLRGDMSLVGPRPDLPDQLRYYEPRDHVRLEVRPGLTGLAQVTGRNELSWAERRAIDVAYVENRSLAMDLMILARTIPRVLGGRGVFGRTRT